MLLAGEPGSGKTTVCRRVIDATRNSGASVAGLLTEARQLVSGRVVQTVLNLRTGERRRLAEYVGTEEGEPLGRGAAGRFSWQFSGDALRWGRHELARCASARVDLLVIDQLGPLELVAGSGWSNAVDVLREGCFPAALIIVNPLVLDDLRLRLENRRVLVVDVNEATQELLPEYIGRLLGFSSVPGHPHLTRRGPDYLVADLDGTLLATTGDPLAPGVIAALREAADAGIVFIVCTGRTTEFATAAVNALGVEQGYAVTYGGAEISDLASGEVLDRVALAGDVASAVSEVARKAGLSVDRHESGGHALRLVLTSENGWAEDAEPLLADAVGDAVRVLRPSPGVVVVQAREATKETALAALAARLGAKRGALAYMGDGADDVEALRWAGLGIAVTGETEDCEAAAAADVVVPRRLVAETITRMALARRLRSFF